MHAEAIHLDEQFSRQSYDYIIVGTGPVGIRAAQELSKLNPSCSIAIFGDEPWQPYNRVKLSSLISGEISEDALYSNYDLSDYPRVTTFYNNRIEHIDRYAKSVLDEAGKAYHYDELILATGSRPRVPAIEGVDLENVFTFRDLNDAQKLMGRSVRTRKTVIIGGGILGLETARAMQRFNTEVHVIEHSMWLMFNQLDNRAGSYLKRHIESLGIYVHTDTRIKKLEGERKVEAIIFENGDRLECDTVIVAAGIVPNSSLALEAGLAVRKGIRVNNQLQTLDKNIYAIGECAEHNDEVYGLVAPGLEQASVVAHHLTGDKVEYLGSTSATHLKVLDYPVFSMGDTDISVRSREEVIYQDHKNEIYRKLVIINGRIRSAIGIGAWPGVSRFQEAAEKKRRIWPWQVARFREEGLLWNDATSENVIDWPATATVCNCTGVTRGQLDAAMSRGACSVIELANATGASTVCGSCKPLLNDYVGSNASPEPDKAYKAIIPASILSLFAVLFLLLLPAYPYSASVLSEISFDVLWRDGFLKQVSGFTLLGLSILISFISLRKRLPKFISLLDYSYWRATHIVLGSVILLALFTHTGFRFGDNLNFYLMMVFAGLLLAGVIASTAIGFEHRLPRQTVRYLRRYAVWSHIVLLWPLPALLGFHILKTYYF